MYNLLKDLAIGNDEKGLRSVLLSGVKMHFLSKQFTEFEIAHRVFTSVEKLKFEESQVGLLSLVKSIFSSQEEPSSYAMGYQQEDATFLKNIFDQGQIRPQLYQTLKGKDITLSDLRDRKELFDVLYAACDARKQDLPAGVRLFYQKYQQIAAYPGKQRQFSILLSTALVKDWLALITDKPLEICNQLNAPALSDIIFTNLDKPSGP